MQKWRRLGHVFCADGHTPWMFTHASYPTPVPQDDGTFRVFFSPRDQENRSTIASLNLALDGSGESRLISNFSGLSPLAAPGADVLSSAPREPATNPSYGSKGTETVDGGSGTNVFVEGSGSNTFQGLSGTVTSTAPQELQTSLAGPGPSPLYRNSRPDIYGRLGRRLLLRRARHPIAWEAGYDQQLPDCRGASRHLHFHAEERGGVDKLRGRRRWHVYRNTSWRRRCQRHPGRR